MIEIHYEPFLFFKGKLFKKEPLIIFDAPKYQYNQNSIDVVLHIKRCDTYPIFINSVSIEFEINGVTHHSNFEINQQLNSYLYYKIFTVYHSDLQKNSMVNLYPTLSYDLGNRKRKTTVSNINGINKKCLEVTLCCDSYSPNSSHEDSIDFHTHSSFTDDFVEFGSHYSIYENLLGCVGLTKFALTDHSYDLDDREEQYFDYDEDETKWKKLQEIDNKYRSIIVGEEVSCGNEKGKNIHLIVLNNKTLIRGYGDGGEKLFFNKPTVTLEELKKREDDVLIAAHPFVQSSFFEDLLLNRGTYSYADLMGIEFIQIINGNRWVTFQKDLNFYIKRWQNGEKTVYVAGNDSHGYFGWSPKLIIPLLKASYNEENLFGRNKTILPKTSKYSATLKENMRKCSITTGPYFSVLKKAITYNITAKSFNHFGAFTKLTKISFNKYEVKRSEFIINSLIIDTTFAIEADYYTFFVAETTKGEICMSNVLL